MRRKVNFNIRTFEYADDNGLLLLDLKDLRKLLSAPCPSKDVRLKRSAKEYWEAVLHIVVRPFFKIGAAPFSCDSCESSATSPNAWSARAISGECNFFRRARLYYFNSLRISLIRGSHDPRSGRRAMSTLLSQPKLW